MALLAVVAAALGGIGLATWQNVRARQPRTVADLGADFLPDAAQHIRDFKRVKVKDGKAVWEVKAEDARYRDDGEIIISKPQVTFFTVDGKRRANLVGVEGRLTLDVKGTGLEVDVTPQRMRLLADVHTVLRHDAAAHKS